MLPARTAAAALHPALSEVAGPPGWWTKSMTEPAARVGVHQTRTQLSRLLRSVDAGQEVEKPSHVDTDGHGHDDGAERAS